MRGKPLQGDGLMLGALKLRSYFSPLMDQSTPCYVGIF